MLQISTYLSVIVTLLSIWLGKTASGNASYPWVAESSFKKLWKGGNKQAHQFGTFITVMMSSSQSTTNRTVGNNWWTNFVDGRWVSFVLGFPHLQRENSLNLKKLQTVCACLWFETTTPWKQHSFFVKEFVKKCTTKILYKAL